MNEAVKRRRTLLRNTDDGIVIADEDFRLRGGGNIMETKQSGLPGFRLADPIEQEGLLKMANRVAAVLLQKDLKPTSERGRAVSALLRVFEKAAAMRTLAAGWRVHRSQSNWGSKHERTPRSDCDRADRVGRNVLV